MHPEIGIIRDGHVALLEMRRPPHNFMDVDFIAGLADALNELDADRTCRAVVLAAQGKSFCAGANFTAAEGDAGGGRALLAEDLYRHAVKLFRNTKPIVAAVHGPAVGGGLGLALAADFRITCDEAVFSANFARLGFHAGFGITATLPALIGPQKAAMLLYTGRRIRGGMAVAIGLADDLAPAQDVRAKAMELAAEIAAGAPLAVASMRHTLRRGLADRIQAATEREAYEQRWQRTTADHQEGIAAMNERRPPVFNGR